MNVINQFFLKVALSPQKLYGKMGVNPQQLKAILATKLIMDDRRPNTFQQTRVKKSVKPLSGSTLFTMAMSVVLGAFFLTGFSFGHDFVTHLSFYYTFYILFLASTLITDFTSVLIDVRDNYIILPKPVNDRTVVVARLLHISVHISKLVIPMVIPGMVYLLYKSNLWGAFVFLVLTGMATLFSIFLISSLYIVILKITTPKKFQVVISYFQVIFAILIFGSYQILPQMLRKASVAEFDISTHPWAWMLPPYWFAGAWQGISQADYQPAWIAASLISLTVPFICLWIVVKYFAPSFNTKLSLISGNSESHGLQEFAGGRQKKRFFSSYASTLAGWFTKPGAERMTFLFCWKMTARSKDFKLKVYPSFGYMLVYFVFMFFNSRRVSINDIAEETTSGKFVIVSVLYFSTFMLSMALGQLVYSDKHKAAWIYFTAPVNSPGELMSGAVKSVLIKFYVPVMLFISAASICIVGFKIIPNLLLGICNELFICFFIAYVGMQYLPFSTVQSNKGKAGDFLRNLFLLIIPVMIGLIHYLVYSMVWVVGLLGLMSLAASWLLLGSINTKSWKKVKTTYEEN